MLYANQDGLALCGKMRDLLSLEKYFVKIVYCEEKSATLISRNFCVKMVIVNFCNFYTVSLIQFQFTRRISIWRLQFFNCFSKFPWIPLESTSKLKTLFTNDSHETEEEVTNKGRLPSVLPTLIILPFAKSCDAGSLCVHSVEK